MAAYGSATSSSGGTSKSVVNDVTGVAESRIASEIVRAQLEAELLGSERTVNELIAALREKLLVQSEAITSSTVRGTGRTLREALLPAGAKGTSGFVPVGSRRLTVGDRGQRFECACHLRQ